MPDSSRREFLTGQAALCALAEVKGRLAPPLEMPDSSRSYLVHVSRQAMACLFEVALNAGQYPHGTEAAMEALDLIDLLEDQLSIYREHSEVSRLNRRAAQEPIVVEERLFGLLVQARQLFEETGGAFDITSGPLTRIWGFYRRQGRMPTQVEIDAALACVGSQWLELDAEQQSVRFARPGMEINLGAIGKGHALDRAADLMDAAGVHDFLIHGGASSVLARGSRDAGQDSGFGVQGSEGVQRPPLEVQSQAAETTGQVPDFRHGTLKLGPKAGWRVALKHPLKPDERLAEFVLRNQALGTSGSGTQFFHYQGKRYGHILDPRSGWPADQVLAATVIAPTAALGDALSTAFYVGGIELARTYCQKHPEISALLITPAHRAGGIELFPMNLAADQWRPWEGTD
jgi:thiamine biosynthesis lipoprotein